MTESISEAHPGPVTVLPGQGCFQARCQHGGDDGNTRSDGNAELLDDTTSSGGARYNLLQPGQFQLAMDTRDGAIRRRPHPPSERARHGPFRTRRLAVRFPPGDPSGAWPEHLPETNRRLPGRVRILPPTSARGPVMVALHECGSPLGPIGRAAAKDDGAAHALDTGTLPGRGVCLTVRSDGTADPWLEARNLTVPGSASRSGRSSTGPSVAFILSRSSKRHSGITSSSIVAILLSRPKEEVRS